MSVFSIMRYMNEQVKQYLKDHWISMAISLASSSLVFIIALINLYVNFRVDTTTMKQSVQADKQAVDKAGQAYTELIKTTQLLDRKVTQIDQKVTDDHEAIEDIHRWFFGNK